MEIRHSDEKPNSVNELSILYQCWTGGPIVSKPSDCPERDTWRKFDVASINETFGTLELSGLTEDTSPKTTKNTRME